MAESPADSLLLSPADVAAHLRISLSSARRLLKSGDIPTFPLGGKNVPRVKRSDLEAYVAKLAAASSEALADSAAS